jgi:hypothetical protein
MKRLFFAAIALFGGISAFAQPSASSTASVTLNLNDAIEILPPVISSYSATWANAADYNGGAKSLGTEHWVINSTNTFHITAAMGPVMSGANSFPRDKFSFSLTAENTTNPPLGPSSYSGGVVNAAGTFFTPGMVPNIATFQHGPNSLLAINLMATPGWNNLAGVYTGTLTVTATQP